MVGKSKDPKGTRITVRISENDLNELQTEARKRNCTVGAVVRFLIRDRLGAETTITPPNPLVATPSNGNGLVSSAK